MGNETEYRASCHCGACQYSYFNESSPRTWSVRLCGCSFCRAHGAVYTSDPAARAIFRLPPRLPLVRYRFALRTADFLLCGACGVFLGAMIVFDGRVAATLNLNAFAQAPSGLATPVFGSFEGESPEQRLDRRIRTWTPVVPD